MQTQTFMITPKGKIRGGSASYLADETTGDLSYRLNVTVGIAFFKKTVNLDGQFKIDPALLLSANLKENGQQIQIGSLVMTVTDLGPLTAQVKLEMPGASGFATLSVAGQYLKMTDLEANAVYSGVALEIELTRSLQRKMKMGLVDRFCEWLFHAN